MRCKKNILISILTLAVSLISAAGAGTADCYAKDSITNSKELENARSSVYEQYVKSISSRKNELQSGKIKIGNYTMTFSAKVIGKPDENGYPVYFGLHGGGTPNTDLQKEQYEIMKDYYSNSISSGIYIVPLGLEARYDEHYMPESFQFYDRLIEDAVIFNNGDPNRVYMMGFSSGGDGVYGIAPLYADKLAAVNMSAGFPHVHKLENMYNLPICLQVGEFDSAFGRSLMVAEYDSWLKELKQKYKGGYIHETFIHKGGDHNNWDDVTNRYQMVVDKSFVMDWLQGSKNVKYVSADTDAVRWVSKYTRNPIPEKVVWATNASDGLRKTKAFYWLDRDGCLDNTTVVASYDKAKNTITIEQCDATNGTLKVYLNNNMVDLFKEVTVVVQGKNFKIKPVISTEIMKGTLKARGDINYMFDAQIDIQLSQDKNKIKVNAASSYKSDYDVKGIDNLVKWNSDDLFLVDNSLFGITYDQLCKKLGVSLAKPEKWTYWGNNLLWTSYTVDDNHSIVFMFQNNKTAIIYSEREGAITKKVISSAARTLGARRTIDGLPTTESEVGILTMNNCSRFYIEDNVYDGKSHMVQKYVYYKYKD